MRIPRVGHRRKEQRYVRRARALVEVRRVLCLLLLRLRPPESASSGFFNRAFLCSAEQERRTHHRADRRHIRAVPRPTTPTWPSTRATTSNAGASRTSNLSLCSAGSLSRRSACAARSFGSLDSASTASRMKYKAPSSPRTTIPPSCLATASRPAMVTSCLEAASLEHPDPTTAAANTATLSRASCRVTSYEVLKRPTSTRISRSGSHCQQHHEGLLVGRTPRVQDHRPRGIWSAQGCDRIGSD